jgi:hypothetical protein
MVDIRPGRRCAVSSPGVGSWLLTTGERMVSAAVAGLFGVALVALKALAH